MKNAILLLLLIIIPFFSCNKRQEKQLEISKNIKNNSINFHLEGIQYDSLFIVGKNTLDKTIKIAGKEKEKGFWSFTIPDSILDFLPHFEIRYRTSDTVANISYKVEFNGVIDNDTTKVFYFNVDEKYPTIYGRYIGQKSYDDWGIVEKGGKEVVEMFHFIHDKFLIINNDSSDACLRIQEPYFSYFWDLKGNDKKYDDFINEYTNMAAKFPDSKYLITNLSRTLFNYKSHDDVRTIYNNLSDKYKKTTWGQNIERYLNGKFENIILPSGETGALEPIILDSTKYNLIIFSASWCRP